MERIREEVRGEERRGKNRKGEERRGKERRERNTSVERYPKLRRHITPKTQYLLKMSS